MASDSDNESRSEVARRVRLVARLVGLPERDMAKATGVGRATLGRIMRGEREASWEDLAKIAAGTGVPERYLTHGTVNKQTVDWVMRVMGAGAPGAGRPVEPIEQIRALLEAQSAVLERIAERLQVDPSGVQEALEDLARTGRRTGRTEPAAGTDGSAPARPAQGGRQRRGKR